MKKIVLYLLLTFSFQLLTLHAQTPDKMSYQAVVRDANNNLVSNTQVGIEINIYQGSTTGTQVYTETQTPTTNDNGLLTIEIGGQTDFDAIDWANAPYFLETNIDPTGGTNYTITGVSQLLTVPYALHAKTADNITNGITETDPLYTAWNKSYNDLSDKPNITDTVNTILDTITQFVRTELDGDPNNELQNITISNDTIYLSNGGFVRLPENNNDNGIFYYYDNDNDGFGDKARPLWLPLTVNAPNSFIINNNDCNDADASINPDADEICGDGIDQDCNGEDLQCDNLDIDNDND